MNLVRFASMFPLALATSVLSAAGCATVPVNRAVSAVNEAFVCRTPGIMDSGYTVSIAPENGQSLHGTIATVSAWGTDKPLYDGPFSIEIIKTAATKSCYAQLKSAPQGVKTAGAENPLIHSEGDGHKTTMTLREGGISHELSCKLPKPLVDRLADCEAQLKQDSASSAR